MSEAAKFRFFLQRESKVVDTSESTPPRQSGIVPTPISNAQRRRLLMLDLIRFEVMLHDCSSD